MNQNMNTGVFEITSNNDHIYIQGTEENNIELLSLKGKTELNTNSCTYDRFRDGFGQQFYFYTKDYYNKYIRVFGTRFMYDSQGDAHENITIKQNSFGGLHNILPTTLTNNNVITIEIKIHENTLDTTDIFMLKFLNIEWNIKALSTGEHVYQAVMPSNAWLLNYGNRWEFFNIDIKNASSKNKKFDFEIKEISINNKPGVLNTTDEFQSVDVHSITIQEKSLEPINEYRLNGDTASRLNILNKQILDTQQILI